MKLVGVSGMEPNAGLRVGDVTNQLLNDELLPTDTSMVLDVVQHHGFFHMSSCILSYIFCYILACAREWHCGIKKHFGIKLQHVSSAAKKL